MPKVTQNNFGGGITKDRREPSTNKCSFTQNFDILNYPNKLVPIQGTEADENTTYVIRRFLVDKWGSNVNLLGLGATATNRAEIYRKNIPTGDIFTGTWTTALTASGAATQNTTDYSMWHAYQDYIYFASGARYIGRIGAISSGDAATMNDTYYDATSFSTCTDAVTHSKDDIMYFGLNNKLYKNNAGTISLALTLPSIYKLTSVCGYQNYLAIACAPINDIGLGSIVYLWDRDSTLANLSESFNWGAGNLNVLTTISGTLVGVSYELLGTFNRQARITIREYSGGTVNIIKEVVGDTVATGGTVTTTIKQRDGDRLYFILPIKVAGTNRYCIGVLGKTDYGWVLSGDVSVNNDTLPTSIHGFLKVGDYWWHSFNTNHVYRTNDSSSILTATSIYETLINTNMPLADRHKHKILRAVSLNFEKITSAGETVVLKYKVNGATSWTSIFSTSTQGETQKEATAESDGTPFLEGEEFEFRIESTLGAVPTELSYRYDVVTSQSDG